MKEGKKVRRRDWDEGVYIYLVVKKSSLYHVDGSEESKVWYSSSEEYFSIEDVLTIDWEEVK